MSCTLMRDQEEPKENLSFLWMNSIYAIFSVFALIVAVVVQSNGSGSGCSGFKSKLSFFSLGSLLIPPGINFFSYKIRIHLSHRVCVGISKGSQ